MFATWPELLFLAPFAALFVRLALATIFTLTAWRRFRSRVRVLQVFALIDIIIALAFFFGARTQLVAVFALVCLFAWLIKKEWRPLPRSTVALALVMAFTLIITGPGPLAYDLPL